MRKMIALAAPAAILVAGTAALAVTELAFEPSADSYNWWANQPHGDRPYLELFQEVSPNPRQAIGMMAFDVSGLSSIDPSDIVSARLELQAGYAGHYWNLNGDWGLLSIKQRAIAFDEIEPNPLPDSFGPALAETLVPVGYTDSIITLESSALLDQVRNWAANPGANYGFDIHFEAVGQEGSSFYMAIYSREYLDPALRPQLLVGVSEIPNPGVGSLLGSGLLCMMGRRRR